MMETDNHRLLPAIAAVAVVIPWLGVLLLLNAMQDERNVTILVAPASGAVLAVVFFFMKRGKQRLSGEENTDSTSLINEDTNAGSELHKTVVDLPSYFHPPPPEAHEPPLMIVAAPIAVPQLHDTTMLEGNGQIAFASETPPAVAKVMEAVEKSMETRCILIAASSHGILQDRLNNWLSGKYGKVVSTSMAANEKGFYLAVFYEPFPTQA